MPNTFTLIQAITVGSGGQAAIDFTSIPSTYTDLCLKLSARGTTNNIAENFTTRLNGSSSSIYTAMLLYSAGTAAASAVSANQAQLDYGLMPGVPATTSTFGNAEIYIPNYAGNANKSLSIDEVTENNATTSYAAFISGIWASTSAINQITLTASAGNFAQYSTAYLYGIVKS
jgi:hypothetical protein